MIAYLRYRNVIGVCYVSSYALQYFSKHKYISPTQSCDCSFVLSLKLWVVKVIQYLPCLNIQNVALIILCSTFFF